MLIKFSVTRRKISGFSGKSHKTNPEKVNKQKINIRNNDFALYKKGAKIHACRDLLKAQNGFRQHRKIVMFIYNVTFLKVTMPILENDEAMKRIFGKVEIKTITKKMNGKKLKQTERNYLYRSIRPKLIAIGLISQKGILKKINIKKTEDDSLIEYNLSIYGYDLIVCRKTAKRKIPIEELAVKILESRRARYIEALPVLLIKNDFDKFKLIELAAENKLKNKLGYILEIADMIKPNPKLKEMLEYLSKNKDKEIDFLVEGDYDFLLKTSPARVRKWNLLGRFFDDDFRKNAEAYL